MNVISTKLHNGHKNNTNSCFIYWLYLYCL